MSEGTEIHVSTKEKPGDFDAFETAKPGEPIFTLQGGDPIAPLIVMGWAWFARKHARKLANEGARQEVIDKLLSKATSAEHVAWAMKDYQKGAKPVPAERASYSDNEAVTEAGLSKHQTRRALITMVEKLHDLLSRSNDLAETLAALEFHPDVLAVVTAEARSGAVAGINQATVLLREAAEAIEPRRGMERS